MKQINIVWDKEGLVDGAITGVATISEGKGTINMSPVRPFRIEVSENTTSIMRMGGYLPPATDEHRDLISTLARCYYNGLTRKTHIHHWIT
jgi:hypothetical protein